MKIVNNTVKQQVKFSDTKAGDVFTFIGEEDPCMKIQDPFEGDSTAVYLQNGTLTYVDSNTCVELLKCKLIIG